MLLKLKFVGDSKGLFKYEIIPNIITPEKPATANKPITPAVTDIEEILDKVEKEGIRISQLETDGVKKTLFLPTHHYLCPTEGTVIETNVESFVNNGSIESKSSIINYFPDLKTPEHKAKQDAFVKKKKQLEEKMEILGLVDIWDIKGDTQMELIENAFNIQDRRDRRELHKAKMQGINAMNKMRMKMLIED